MATKTPGRRTSQGKKRARRRRLGVFIGVVLIVALAAAVYQLMGPASEAVPPKALAVKPGAARGRNVVLITLDTTRADRIGCYGYEAAETPNLDALAAGGVRVADAVTCVPLTLPAHAAILTGRYPPRLGVRDNGLYRLDEKHHTLAERLKEKGYATAAFIAAFVLDKRYGLDQGFDEYDDNVTLKYRRPGVRQASPQRPADAVIDSALTWLDDHCRRNPQQPFFMWVHLFDAHTPYAPPEPFRSRFADSPYDGEIAFADQQAGRLIERLRELGRIEQSLIVVLGDHGEGLGQHHEPGHSLLIYDTTMRVPLILYAPKLWPAGVVVDDRVVATVDVMATVLDLIGEPVEELDGLSLLQAAAPDRAVYMETLSPRLNHGWSALFGLRTHRDKYIEAPTPEYYDLRTDPAEARNALDDNVARGNALANLLEQMRASFPDDAGGGPTVVPDSDAMQKLQALGYLGGTPPGAAAAGPRPDPKDQIVKYLAELTKAAQWVDQGRFAEAVPHIRRVLEDNLLDARLWHLLSLAQLGLGQLEQALASRKKTIELQPEDVVHWIRMAHLQLALGDREAAAAALDQAVAVDPDDGEIYLLRARLAADAGDFERALLECRQARLRDPTRHTAMSFSAAGSLYDRLNRPRDAKEAYERAYAADPLDSGALLGLARVAAREGRSRRATEVANRILPGETQWFSSRLLVARAYLDLGEGENAIRTMTDMIAALPGHARPQNNLGNVYFRLDRLDEAVAAYETALKLNPRYAKAHYNLGNALEKTGRVDQALRHYRTAVEIDPRQTGAQIALTRVDTRAGRLAEAFRRLETLLSDGVATLQQIEADPELAPLVADPRFKQLERFRKPSAP